MQQGEGGDLNKESMPEDPEGMTFEYMSVDDAVLPHQSPKMDSRDMGATECEPHCNSECVDECEHKYHTPEKCPHECKKDCYNYCKPLYGTLNNVGDKLVQNAEGADSRKSPLYSQDIEEQHAHTRWDPSEDENEDADSSDASGDRDGGRDSEKRSGGEGGGGRKINKKISATSRYFGGNPAVQWLAASAAVLVVMGVVGVVVQRRLGGGKFYVSVPTSMV